MDLISWRGFSACGRDALVCDRQPAVKWGGGRRGSIRPYVCACSHITTDASHGILTNLNFAGCKYCSFSRKETIQRKQISKEKGESSCLSRLSFLLFPSSSPFFPSCLASKVDKAGLWMRGAFIWTDCLSLWQKARVVRGEYACVLQAR